MEEERQQLSVRQTAFYLPVSLLDPCIAALPAGAERVQTFPHPLCCLGGDKSSQTKTSRHNLSLAHIGTSCSLHMFNIWGLHCYWRPSARKSSGLWRTLLEGRLTGKGRRRERKRFTHALIRRESWGRARSIPQCTGNQCLFVMRLHCDLRVTPPAAKSAESRGESDLSNLVRYISWLHLVTTSRAMKDHHFQGARCLALNRPLSGGPQ